MATTVLVAAPGLAGPEDDSCKTSGVGCEVWSARYEGPAGSVDSPRSLAVGPGGTVAVTGTSAGTIDDSGDPVSDFATVAYDGATGGQLWADRYDGPAAGGDAAWSAGFSPDGAALFVTGYSESADTGTDYTTLAYDAADGVRLWEARYDGTGTSDVAIALAVAPDGTSVYVTGYSVGALQDFATIAYDAATGEQKWAVRYNGPSGNADVGTSIGVSPDGTRVFVGGYSIGANLGDYAVVAYDATTGEQLWVTTYDGPGNGQDIANSLVVSPDGSKVFAGGFSAGDGTANDYATIAVDAASGEFLWAGRYDGPVSRADTQLGLAVDPSGATVFATGTSTNVSSDFATVAFDAATGERRWTGRYDGPGDAGDQAQAVTVTPDGSYVFVTGKSYDHSSVDDYATLTYSATTGELLWISRYDGPGGGFDWAFRVAAAPDSSAVYVAGHTATGTSCTTCMDYETVSYQTTPPGPPPVLDPEPTPTPTPTPTPEPPLGDRGIYPVAPDDEHLRLQWGPQKISAPEAWQERRATGHGIKVAVIDTGVDLEHEDLQCEGKLRVVEGADFSEETDGTPDDVRGHGSHVAGIIGACTNNNTGIVGVAPDSIIVPIQVFGKASSPSWFTISRAVRKATDAGAHVINMSLSTFLSAGSYTSNFTSMRIALARAADAGVVAVASAGNDSFPLCAFPALTEHVICVGATDPRDVKSAYSSFPNEPAEDGFRHGVVAPGGTGVPVFCSVASEDILSLYPVELDPCNEGRPGYYDISGTSMAAPHVAGVAALVYDRLGAARNRDNAQAVEAAILSTAADLGTPGYDPIYGHGRVDALAAVNAVEPAEEEPIEAPTTASFTANTPASGQYGDDATVEALLIDDAGDPVADAVLEFSLSGSGGNKTWASTTGADGIASSVVLLDLAPAGYELAVSFQGDEGRYEPSSAMTAFTIDREITVMTLEVEGRGNDGRLLARLADDDATPKPVSSKNVDFIADGVPLGAAQTDADGTATFDLPPRYANGPHDYEAVFAGDDLFYGSSATTSTNPRSDTTRTARNSPGWLYGFYGFILRLGQ